MLTFLGEARLVDVDAVADRTSHSSDLFTHRRHFRANVIERDGTCVLTGPPTTVDDIPYSPQREANEASPDSRLTLHYFVDLLELGDMITTGAPRNTDARQPQDTGEWPPAIILDLFYAVAAINAWSPKFFVKYARECLLQ